MTIHAVLLIPGEGRESLLAEGPGGYRPPRMWKDQRTSHGRKGMWWACNGTESPGDVVAFVLVDKRAAFAPGCLAARPVGEFGFGWLDLFDAAQVFCRGGSPDWSTCTPVGSALVYLDEEGREVTK